MLKLQEHQPRRKPERQTQVQPRETVHSNQPQAAKRESPFPDVPPVLSGTTIPSSGEYFRAQD